MTTTPLVQAAKARARQVGAARTAYQKILEEYRELLARFDRPREQDGATMLELCAKLNISLDDVDRDAYAIQRVSTLREQASRADELREVGRELGAKIRKKRALVKPGTRRFSTELRSLIREQTTAVHRLESALAAEASAVRLRADHPNVFGGGDSPAVT